MRLIVILSSVVALAYSPASSSTPAAEFRKVLTDAQGGSIAEVVIDSAEVTPDCPHAWTVTKKTLHGGRQEGVELIIVDNGTLQLTLCPTRGMGIMDVQMGDVQLQWDSPVQDVVHPHFVNLASRGGLGWLEGFNEFMCRCGLESNGHPGTDKFINNLGDESEMELTLHGKIANIPASLVEVVIDATAPYAIHITGQVNERFLFGPKLELHTKLIVIPGDDAFQLVDEVRNTGAQDQEFQLLYHANFGQPLLEEGAQVVVPVKSVEPFNDHAASDLDDWHTYAAPTTGFVEQVYLVQPLADRDNHTTALLHNKSMDKGASISWSLDELPCLTVWKNTGAVADGYVTGIEPGTNYPNNRSIERKAGRVPVLAPGESRQMKLTFRLFEGIDNVAAAVDGVRDIGFSGQGIDGNKIKVDLNPQR